MRISSMIGGLALVAALNGAALAQPALPDYYPDTYGEIVEASRGERGLVIYSNMADNNWQPVIAGFREAYPWINVETLDLGSGTVHSRWEAEAGSGSRTADILVSGANDRWASYGKDGRMMAYDSPEFAHLPDFANPYPGVAVLSADPLVITYNAALLPEEQRPTGFAALSAAAVADPGTFDGRITTYDAARNSFGLAAWWAYMNAKGDEGWQNLRAIGPMIRGETSGGPMNEKIATGEYVIGVAVSGITIFPRLEQPGGEILGFAFPDDGTIVMLRGLGIPKEAANPNSAKLFADYALSNAGQTLLGKGGLVPYRDDVAEGDVRYTYQGIAEQIGADNVIEAGFDQRLITEAPAFVEKWNAALQGR
ncbi:iron(III) transport system substrate-binding protein [Aureimonas altamirensis DSM 21988]|uniref:Iron(III) transport system substrate-binding protein n=1 Tax=Aureimonas altamirensis DSM 21988 TaxID=1121026 RepID=A0ABY1IPJ9_9HYPH|nr:extracellular solute-binding protein [Aureimonas altamirensis]SHJ78253.1 iron(III) transport system substrate-binding protein [Aureimonas altamirensis DSM 21988]